MLDGQQSGNRENLAGGQVYANGDANHPARRPVSVLLLLGRPRGAASRSCGTRGEACEVLVGSGPALREPGIQPGGDQPVEGTGGAERVQVVGGMA